MHTRNLLLFWLCDGRFDSVSGRSSVIIIIIIVNIEVLINRQDEYDDQLLVRRWRCLLRDLFGHLTWNQKHCAFR